MDVATKLSISLIVALVSVGPIIAMTDMSSWYNFCLSFSFFIIAFFCYYGATSLISEIAQNIRIEPKEGMK